MTRRTTPFAAAWTAILVLWAQVAAARTIEIYPSTASTDEEFERVAGTLVAGDTLVLHGGEYSQTGRRSITVNGTAAAPIVIRAAAGELPIITRPESNLTTQNNIEIDNSSYLILRGLSFRGGSIGFRVLGGHHVTMEDCEVAYTGNNAVAMNSGNCDAMVFRRNHIHHTGIVTSSITEGEGFYVGCNYNSCRVSNSIFEGNYIHHLRGTSNGGNDGIEVKVGSYGNLVRNNVIHDTNIGQSFPGIFVYGGGSAVNTVEGNVIWNAGEGIQVISDAVIRNNIILTSSIAGISSAPHTQVSAMRNVTIVNNTIYGHPDGLYLRWSNATNMVLANNAIYCPGATAVDASGLAAAGITVASNFVEGGLAGATLDGVAFSNGGSANAVFGDPAARDFWPVVGAPFLGAAVSTYAPSNDFNETPRTAPFDVGAYETEGLSGNPGWAVVPGFKGTPPQLDLVAPAATQDLRIR